MTTEPISPAFSRHIVAFGVTMSAALLCMAATFAQPFAIQGPGVNSNDFRITTFASGLDFPLGMAKLSDGSLLVAVSQGANFFNSTGAVIRLTDTNEDGIADGPGTALCTNLPGSQTALRVGGDLVFVTGSSKPITILRAGALPSDPLTFVGQLIINYPVGFWLHPNSALGLRKTPGETNSYDLLFQVGSESNFAATARTAILTNNNIPGATGTLPGDSAYMLTIIDHGSSVTTTNLTHLATGLRNPAGFAFHPATGDLYFQDNGIDGLVNASEPLSADELNFISRTNLDGSPEFFGFPTNYTAYRASTNVGAVGLQPLIAFQPIPDPFTGHESEGANDITFAPSSFPDGLNNGIFLGFHGKFNFGGTNNEENPVVYANPATGAYFHFIAGQQPGVGHLDGLLATSDSLFVADFVSTGNTGNGAGLGVIYQIKSLVSPTPPPLGIRSVGSEVELTWDRGSLQETDELSGPWTNVVDAFSPHLAPPNALHRFYRLRY